MPRFATEDRTPAGFVRLLRVALGTVVCRYWIFLILPINPCFRSDGMIALVFNGEIYNFQEIRSRLESAGHRFRTRSDTEVILELYIEKQEALVEDLNGMFSIAIWDERKKSLFLARDRLGKKPLYYHQRGGRLSFSSELFSLIRDAAVPRGMSEQALFEYLLYDFIPGPHSIFRRRSQAARGPYGHL